MFAPAQFESAFRPSALQVLVEEHQGIIAEPDPHSFGALQRLDRRLPNPPACRPDAGGAGKVRATKSIKCSTSKTGRLNKMPSGMHMEH